MEAQEFNKMREELKKDTREYVDLKVARILDKINSVHDYVKGVHSKQDSCKQGCEEKLVALDSKVDVLERARERDIGSENERKDADTERQDKERALLTKFALLLAGLEVFFLIAFGVIQHLMK